MRFSENWLRQWINPPVDSATLAHQLTMAGLEVDSVKAAVPGFNKIVIGQIDSIMPHPDADKLRCCKVNVGNEVLDIVTNAKNVDQHSKIAVALVGAVLPDGLEIKKAKLRGQPSFGMFCAVHDLGIESEPEGVLELSADAPIGMDIREYFDCDDFIVEIELTPNRGDCLSLRGVAREVAQSNQRPFKDLTIEAVKPQIDDALKITLQASDRCPKYAGRIIKGINGKAKSPQWLKQRLARSGIRSINAVVDVCNYVMLEIGQPMHAFDLDRLDSEIRVRTAKKGETLTLLDEQQLQLTDSTLVIADRNKPQAVAGVMGGLHSAVTGETQNIFLESAYFDAVGVRKDAKRYGLKTDSSYRFERGVDFQLQQQAIERATALLLEIVGGQAAQTTVVIDEKQLPKQSQLSLRHKQIKRLLGIELNQQQVQSILKSLEFEVTVANDQYQVTVPSFRFDITQEIDLIEEVARVYGYDNISSQQETSTMKMRSTPENYLRDNRIAGYFVDRGYQEIISYSFIDPKDQQLFDPTAQTAELANPLSEDMSVMRTSLLPSLVNALNYNLHRQQSRGRFFETALVFTQHEGAWKQTPKLGAIIYGDVCEQQWGQSARIADFYDLKQDLNGLLRLAINQGSLRFEKGEHAALHPGQSATLWQNDQIVGHLGALHPRIAQHFALNRLPYLLEVDLQAVSAGRLPEFESISKFPAVRRDLAFVVDLSVTSAQLSQQIRETAGGLLKDLQIFDVYQGDRIESGKKSVALGLTFVHPSRTLIDTEINELIQLVVKKLGQSFNATLRA